MTLRGKGINLQVLTECICYLLFGYLLFQLTYSGGYLNSVSYTHLFYCSRGPICGSIGTKRGRKKHPDKAHAGGTSAKWTNR